MSHQREFWRGRAKDAYRCTECGRSRAEAKQIDVHHVDGEHGNNHPNNVVGLCRRCHLQRQHERDAEWLGSHFDPPEPTGLGPAGPASVER